VLKVSINRYASFVLKNYSERDFESNIVIEFKGFLDE